MWQKNRWAAILWLLLPLLWEVELASGVWAERIDPPQEPAEHPMRAVAAPTRDDSAPGEEPSSPLIAVSDVNRLMLEGAMIRFVDVRSRKDYEEQHIQGAVSIPLDALPQHIADIPQQGIVILYCACPHELASLAYERLATAGYRDLRVLDEGLPGWITQGLPTAGEGAGGDQCREEEK
jgi:rhodanese-related sulfurtransferase